MKILTAVLLAAALAMSAAAADVEGYLMDKSCSAKAIKDGYAKAGAHSKDCLEMDGCASSGLGVLTSDNKYLMFDKDGSKKAAAVLASSKKNDNIKVKVTGNVSGNTIKVQSITIL